MIDGWGISCEIVLTWMPQDLTDSKSILVQVMAWCHQAITWASVDSVLCPHMAALGLNVLMTVFNSVFAPDVFVSYCHGITRTLCPITIYGPGHHVLLEAENMCNTVWHKCSLSLEGVACYVFFQNREIWILANFWNFSALTLKKIYSSWWILSLFTTNDH